MRLLLTHVLPAVLVLGAGAAVVVDPGSPAASPPAVSAVSAVPAAAGSPEQLASATLSGPLRVGPHVPPAKAGTTVDQLPVDAVGALFPAGSTRHSCSGGVVRSATRDLVVSAAHCVSGTGSGMVFVPGYHDGVAPHGSWRVVAAYADPGWTRHQDPTADVVLLRVVPTASASGAVQDAVGGAVLFQAPPAGTRVQLTGYAAGAGDRVRRCSAATATEGGYPRVTCGSFPGGTSGGPWFALGAGTAVQRLVGVIGGLHQGGCTEQTSYSSPFATQVQGLLARATAHAASDRLPSPGDDGC